MKQSKLTRGLKANAERIANELPERLLKGDKARHKSTTTRRRQTGLVAESNAIAEQSYNQLDGEWLDWLEVARRYEHKVPSQDRYDMRHTILLELAKARQRDRQPIPLLRAYRIASLMVAFYWREQARHQVKVCLYSGLPTEPHCASCRHNQHKPCPYLALRPVQSLNTEIEDAEGNTIELIDTLADDHAIDLVVKLDAGDWLLGCKMKLIQIAIKLNDGIELNSKEKNYLYHFRNRELKKAQKALF